MHWITASLLSAFLIGIFDLCSKHAVRDNAVLPVLFFCTLCGAAVWLAFIGVDWVSPGLLPASLVTDHITPFQHLQLALKSAIVATAWICTYFGLKHLSLSLVAPIRATGPFWVLIGALVILMERPTLVESLGIVITLVSLFGLSVAGQQEGVHFHRNKWVGITVIGVLLNSVSAVYDKYLMGWARFSVPTMQAWFSIYLCVFFVPLAIGWKRRWWPRHEFHWRWSIPFVALSLLAADYVYFDALRNPEALISLVISLRRGSTLVAFAGAILIFGETNWKQKLLPILGVVVGIILTMLG